MTIESPLYLQGLTYSARLDRQVFDLLFTEGVVQGSAFAVTQRAAGANNSVDVALGQAIVDGDDQANQGTYVIRSTAVENVVLTAAPGSNARIDLIFLRINDPNAGGPAGNSATLGVLEGAVAASPVIPTTPTSAIPLARVLRTNGDTSVVNAQITNMRPVSSNAAFTTTSNFEILTTTQRDALTPYAGQTIYNSTTARLESYVGGAWGAIAPVTDVQTFTASGTWTKPAGAIVVIAQVISGGGGGGSTGGAAYASGAGGGGGFIQDEFLASGLGATVTVTVGAGGGVASAGGSSAFGSLSASGGGGGSGATGGVGGGVDGGTGGLDGVGGSPTGGTSTWGGGGGAGGRSNAAQSGTGGSSVRGGGGGAVGSGTVGSSGTSGAGGAGGTSASASNGSIPGGGGGGVSDTPGTGGSGARGEVVVTTYF